MRLFEFFKDVLRYRFLREYGAVMKDTVTPGYHRVDYGSFLDRAVDARRKAARGEK